MNKEFELRKTNIPINAYTVGNDVLEKIERNFIEYVRFYLQKTGSGDVVIVCEHPSRESSVLDKSWQKLHKTRTRIPKFLKPYEGKKVRIYTETIQNDPQELFRIASVDFNIEWKGFKPTRKNAPICPYFTKNGVCVIPLRFSNEHFGQRMLISRLSFNQTGTKEIQSGYIFAYPTIGEERGKLIYPLREYPSGFRTRPIIRVLDIIGSCGKFIEWFKFDYVFFSESLKMKVIVFKEVI